MELRRFYSLPANTKPYLGGGESGLDVHSNDGKGWDVCIVGAHIRCSTGQESQPNILAFTIMVTLLKMWIGNVENNCFAYSKNGFAYSRARRPKRARS